MNNFTMVKQSPSLSMKTVFVNKTRQDGNDYAMELVSRLEWFLYFSHIQTIEIRNFLHKQEINDQTDILKGELKRTKLWLENEGTKRFESLCTLLKTKLINAIAYENVVKMLNHHQKITVSLFRRELTMTRIEVILTYLNELPCYLQTDLDLDSLRSRTVSASLNVKARDTQFYLQPYKLHDDSKVTFSDPKIA